MTPFFLRCLLIFLLHWTSFHRTWLHGCFWKRPVSDPLQVPFNSPWCQSLGSVMVWAQNRCGDLERRGSHVGVLLFGCDSTPVYHPWSSGRFSFCDSPHLKLNLASLPSRFPYLLCQFLEVLLPFLVQPLIWLMIPSPFPLSTRQKKLKYICKFIWFDVPQLVSYFHVYSKCALTLSHSVSFLYLHFTLSLFEYVFETDQLIIYTCMSHTEEPMAAGKTWVDDASFEVARSREVWKWLKISV